MATGIQAPALVEADVSAVEPAGTDNSDLLQSAISGHITSSWNKAKFAKQRITERLLSCERQRRGEYDPDKAADIAETGGSDIYMMITDIKCRAAKSWITDVMFANGDRPFDLEPAEQPDIPPEIKLSIVDFVQQEAQAFLQSGEQLHPDAFRNRMDEVHDMILLKIKEEAKEISGRMAGVIEDQLEQGGFRRAIEDFIDDFVTYPTAIIKGPSIRKKKRLVWGENFQPVVLNDFSRDVERVSPYDFFPSPNASNVNDGFIIQRHRLSTKDVENLRGVPGYSNDEIDQVLIRYGMAGFRYYEFGDQQQDNLKGKYHSRLHQDNVIEALEFWGPVMGSMLKDWGLTKDHFNRKIEDHNVYEVTAWQIGSFVIKCSINPDPLGRRPYEIASWSRIPGAVWGQALPETMSDIQTLCNAAARSLANNMGIGSGPQVEVVVDRLPDGEDVTQMYPWKIWQTTSDKTGGGQPGVRFFQPNLQAAELMGVYQNFAKQADEITGIPNYIYGSGAGGSGAGRTASGLSMLMDNAAKGIKGAIGNIDKVVTMLVDRFYTHNMMYNPDPYIKGDFRVVAKGALGMVAREQIQVRRNEFLAATANPVDLQIVGPEGRAYLLREAAKALQMDTDKIVPSPEMLKFKNEQIQQAMAQQQAMAPQQAAAPEQLDAAGNPGPEPMNLVQPGA